MSDTKTASTGGGIGFGGVLFVVFLVLKLTHTIDWSWWWVTAPLWIPVALFLVVGGFILLIAGIATLTGSRR